MAKIKTGRYVPREHYTSIELDDFALADLLKDAEHAERQVSDGEFYPGITRETLLAYAAKCREQAAKYKDGGAHKGTLGRNHPAN